MNAYTFRDIVKDPGETRSIELSFFGKCANFWRPNELYATNEFVRPTTANGGSFEATIGGTSAAVEPVWPSAEGAKVLDGSVEWTRRPADNNGLNVISAPSAVSDPIGLTISGITVSESVKILATYAGGTLDRHHDAVFTFTLNGVTRIARQRVLIRKR
jgi:hypothetical protein